MVTNPNLILIHGKIGHGKDTVANMINYLAGYDKMGFKGDPRQHIGMYLGSPFRPPEATSFKIKRFAGKLKLIVSLMTGITLADLERQDVKDSYLPKEWNYYKIKTEAGFLRATKYALWTEAAEALFEITQQLGPGDTIVEMQMTVREFLQELGTKHMRGLHPDIHVNGLFADYEPELVIPDGMEYYMDRHETRDPKWIVPDLRFPNEHSRGRQKGGLLVKVVGEFPGVKPKAEKEHESETALDHCKDWDAILTNRGSLTDLLTDVKGMCEDFKLI